MRHKFRAKPVSTDEAYFSSTLEYRYSVALNLRVKSGEILFYLAQVPFRLPGKKKYLLDFMEFHSNGEIICTEVKGLDTPIGKLKIDQVEAIYPVKINLVRKGDF